MSWSNVGLISQLVLWALVIVQAVVTLALARLVGQLMSRRFPGSGARVVEPGPDIGTSVPGWEGVPVLGEVTRYVFPRDRGLFLLYLSPHCSVCNALVPSAKRFFKEIAPMAEGAWVMVLGRPETQSAYAQEKGLTPAVVWGEAQLPESLRVAGAPFGVWIDAGGQVRAKGMVNNREHLESLFNAVKIGHPTVESYMATVAEAEEQERERSTTLHEPLPTSQ